MSDFEKSLAGIEKWFKENPYYGYDPFDVKGHPLTLNLQKYSILRKASNIVFEVAPRLSRQVLGVKSSINHKGIGLIATANLIRYRESGAQHYLDCAEEYLRYLMKNRSSDYPGYSWGYPFDWQSKILIPAGTPSVVVTVLVGEAFLTYKEITNSSEYDDVIKGISKFITHGLNVSTREAGICFSYTPLDNYLVHNANMFAAYYLIRTGIKYDNVDWVFKGKAALMFTLSEQQHDGGFTYWGKEIAPPFIDNFHTGYVLRMLHRINKLDPMLEISKAIELGVEYYINRLFRNNFPLRALNSIYPIDIHTVNEILLVYSELEEYRTKLEPTFKKTLDYLLCSMQGPVGVFHYRHYFLFKVKTPFFRWSQAWTYLSLATLRDQGLV
ncbi:MAG: hypothetical protein U9Q77_06180 [Candidatus Marinimicrobia bacterium]|nr:hypothetical protein [Candidatus Neomarinimicrobiota bacterium]